MALPEELDLGRHRDLERRGVERWVRWAVIAVLTAGLALGLANVFGQATTTSDAAGADAALGVQAPTAVRGGVIYQGRITIRAHRRLPKPRLVLADGWVEGVTINTILPEAAAQDVRAGALVLAYGPIAAGDALTVRVQSQVNPTNVGRRSQDVALLDGTRLVARVHRTVTVFP
jgi:hypothetical protein